MYDDMHGNCNQRRYLWLIGPFVLSKLAFSDYSFSPKELIKYLSPYLSVINDKDNTLMGLPDFT